MDDVEERHFRYLKITEHLEKNLKIIEHLKKIEGKAKMDEQLPLTIDVKCPGCEADWQTSEDFTGFNCPKCGHRVTKGGQPKPQLTLIQGGKSKGRKE